MTKPISKLSGKANELFTEVRQAIIDDFSLTFIRAFFLFFFYFIKLNEIIYSA